MELKNPTGPESAALLGIPAGKYLNALAHVNHLVAKQEPQGKLGLLEF